MMKIFKKHIMRKLIIKLFYLNYLSRAFGITFSFPRGAAIIVPLISLGAYFSLIDNESASVTIAMLIVFLYTLPIIYFRKCEVKFHELNVYQSYMFLKYDSQKPTKKAVHIDSIVKRYCKKTFYNVLPLVLIMVPPILTAIIYLIKK